MLASHSKYPVPWHRDASLQLDRFRLGSRKTSSNRIPLGTSCAALTKALVSRSYLILQHIDLPVSVLHQTQHSSMFDRGLSFEGGL